MFNLTLARDNPSKFYLLLVIAIYVVFYIAFLYVSDFLPYVFDNNETYSSLVHAYNMYFGDWGVHFGLADDAYNLDPTAHPNLHTHQGNWPRIFAYVLFAIGARSAESQIAIHVFTIGLIAIWLMYRFFDKNTNYKFAVIGCLLLMTDYILFTQWQVVTYRIWHVFFVFASLNCVQEISGSSKAWKLFFIFNFAALYYGELVFAFYISVWALLYYAYLVNYNIKRVFKLGLLIAISGMISLILLFIQLCMYMGFENVILDFSYTFMARNFPGDQAEIQLRMQEFYNNMNIAFWNNMVDGSKYRSVHEFIKTIFTYGFQFHTPILTLQAFVVFISILICSIQNYIIKKIININVLKASVISAKTLTFISITVYIYYLCFDNKFMGLSVNRNFYLYGSVCFMLLMQVISLFFIDILFKIKAPFGGKVAVINVFFTNVFILTCARLIIQLSKYYDQNNSIIWFKYLCSYIPMPIWRLLSMFVVFCGSLHIMLGSNNVKSSFRKNNILGVLGVGVSAYIIIYILSPGYIFSGYLVRAAPFIVFFVDILIVVFFWWLIENVFQLYKLNNVQFTNILTKNLVVISAMAMLSLFIYHWLYIQYSYYNLFPPNSAVFIKQLRKPNLHGKTIISNQYAVPFAYEVNNWAYNALTYGAGRLDINNHGFYTPHIFEYLWYKNKNNFSGYKSPDYYVCFSPNTYSIVANELRVLASTSRRCSTNRVVSQALLSPQFNKEDLRLRHKVESIDASKRDMWAIVKMDWEYPPFFTLQKDTQKHYKVSYDRSSKLLTIYYIFEQQNGILESFTKFKIVQQNKQKNNKLIIAEILGNNGKATVKLNKDPVGILEITGIPVTANRYGLAVTEAVNIY